MPASLNIWPLVQNEKDGLTVQPIIGTSSGETLLHLAIAGAGIVCLANFMTRGEIASGRLVPVLEAVTLPWSQPVWAVFYKQGALAPRVSALIEFLVERLTGQLLDD